MTKHDILTSIFGEYPHLLTKMFPTKTDDELIELIGNTDSNILERLYNEHVNRFSEEELQFLEYIERSLLIDKYNESMSLMLGEVVEYMVFLSESKAEVVQ